MLQTPTLEQFARWPSEAQAIYLDLKTGESLPRFIRRVFPHRPAPRHLKPLVQRLERARGGELQRVCFSVPPRHAKTEMLLEANAWWLHRNPVDTNAYFSYNEAQGQSKSRKARAYAQAAGITLRSDSASVSEWRTLPGGGLLAGGIGGALTGQGVSGMAMVDDPFKDRSDADSPVMRERVWEWFNEVVMTRLEGASVFVVHTRWHQDDLIGRLAQQGGWDIVNIPAIAEDNDILGRVPGTALWPERFPVDVLQATKSQIGEFSFAALYQGQPRPRGAKVFGPAHYYDSKKFDVTGKQIILAGDPAASEKTTADYGVLLALAWEGSDPATRRGWVRKVYRHQVNIPQYCRDAVAFQREHGGAKLHIESVGGFKAVPQTLRDTNPAILIEEIVPHGDKFQRAQGVASAWNEGRLLVPMDEPWVPEFLAELEAFTGVKDAHDDQVDGLAHAWNSIGVGAKTKFTAPRPSTANRRRI